MRFKQKLKEWGGSYAIIIPKNIIEDIEAKENDYIEVDIKKINDERIMNSYFCRMCSHGFDSDDEEPYCPICESTGDEIELIKGDENDK